MQLRFLDFQRIPSIHSLKAPSEYLTEKVFVVARATTFIPAGHEAMIQGRPVTQSFPENSEGIFEPTPVLLRETPVMDLHFTLCM